MSMYAVSYTDPVEPPRRVLVDDRDPDGSVSLLIDDDHALVVLHGAIGAAVHQDIRDLVSDLEAGVARGLPIVVLASNVTQVDLQCVWLLLELRRAAAGHGLRIDHPSSAVCDALQVHGLTRLLDPA